MHATIRKISRYPGRQRRLLLLALALLTPLVLALGIHSKLTYYRAADFRIDVSREPLIQTATEFLEARGVSTDGRTPRLRILRNSEYLTHLHWITHRRNRAIRVPELPVGPFVFLLNFAQDDRESRSVSITPDGRVVGYALGTSGGDGEFSEYAREQALLRARDAMTALLRFPDRYQLSEPRVYEQTAESGEPQFRVEWTATHRMAPELSFQLSFGIAGERILSQDIAADVDDTVVASTGVTQWLRSLLTTIAPFYFLALVLYMLIRYLQRAAEQEVSHGRAIVVGLYLIAIMAAIFAVGDAQVLLNLNFEGPESLFVYLFMMLMLGMVAFFGGACYAACEGDVREQFPRSLTSFDALLTGRFLSRNVARAFLIGFAAACWLFALQVAVNLRFEGGLEEPSSITSMYQLVVSNVPLMYVFLLMPVGVGMIMLFGYLAPLSVVARLSRERWIAWLMLAAMSFINLTILHGGYASMASLLLTISAEAALLLWLIVAVDLLTAYVCLVLGSYITLLTDAQLLTAFPDEMQWPMHGVVAATVITSLALLRWGRELSDDEVRPAYARALAERQLLSQQLSTAALAQKQLMLSELPALEGFSLAAECKPAHAVSGDYFDCYPMDRTRAGIFLISGAGRGLLDAMVIAFAKGFLLEHARRDHTAQEVLAALMEALTAVLEPSDRFPELCYLVLDSDHRTATYSRTQGFPELISVRERPGLLPSVKGGGSAELVVTRTLRGGRSVTLSHGATPLDESTTLLIYTCGFSSGLYLAGVLDVREWLRQQWQALSTPDTRSLLLRLTGAAMPRSRAWKQGVPQEDLTLLVARLTGEIAREITKDPAAGRAAADASSGSERPDAECAA
ncbi:MAG: SpoIIE family protein phosphatase [Bryobacterales bacterium]|nr:SpoIIE family protein phosphatase [Bryobacterales bacterium]